ncbi:MAG TPA: SusD/RagB family nutrient-binding outer membrane lipoprotein [Puia sp.]|nr:SusD/RagB family nutrient-binding outer membrane lipoprotein [Puia sp.]
MKKLSILSISAIFLLFTSSCKKYLAINTNPNNATSATPEAILPQAIVYTAANISSYNDYGSQLAGYAANAGGYGGFGSNWTYDFSPNDYGGLWSSTYDALNDLQSVLNFALADTTHLHDYFNGVARIMKVYNFQLLVDTYNNIPFTGALKGTGGLTPKYDDAKTIYPALATQLDSAIAIINAAGNNPSMIGLNTGTDPMFGGNMNSWIQFANTLKLRLIIRASSVISFPNQNFDPAGFLNSDAIVNPGYAKISGQQNPSWNTWVASFSGVAGNRAWMPCTYAFSFYDGDNLLDSNRGKVIYYQFPKTPNNQLGDGLTGVPFAPSNANGWYSGSTSSLGNAAGVMKGLNMGEPLMLAAESDFLRAEADVRGILGGTAKTDFLKGIAASFHYLYLLPDDATINPDTTLKLDVKRDTATYMSDNAGSYLVNFDLATTTAQQIEAIITQKYLALNFINSQEGWNEYRRTGYPRSATITADPTASFASLLSQSSRPDHLPTRILYPASEYSYNAGNVPTGISPYSSLIFWAH